MTEAAGAGEAAVPAAGAATGERVTLEALLRMMAKHRASDLHLKVGAAPVLRIHGKLRNLEMRALAAAEMEGLLRPILSGEAARKLEAGLDVDAAHAFEGGRYRVSIFRQRGALSAALRRVETEIPSFESLHLPGPTMEKLAALRQGLVLVCGVTGSGKSTTLAALLEHVNRTRRVHIVTIEDPIEYLYADKKAHVNQREVGLDVADFHTALRSVVRQDPDVILIGEMRDRETVEAALMAAETGHLVLATLHSSTAAATISRILDFFPADRETQIRQALRFTLKAIICQRLLPGATQASPVVPALEILIVNAASQKAIAEREDKKLEQIVRGGRQEGMCDLNASLLDLVKRGLIAEKTALEASSSPEQLEMNLKGIFLGDDRKILG